MNEYSHNKIQSPRVKYYKSKAQKDPNKANSIKEFKNKFKVFLKKAIQANNTGVMSIRLSGEFSGGYHEYIDEDSDPNIDLLVDKYADKLQSCGKLEAYYMNKSGMQFRFDGNITKTKFSKQVNKKETSRGSLIGGRKHKVKDPLINGLDKLQEKYPYKKFVINATRRNKRGNLTFYKIEGTPRQIKWQIRIDRQKTLFNDPEWVSVEFSDPIRME